MNYIFSQHALEQMKRRNIEQSQVFQVLKYPDKIIKQENISIYQASVDLSGNYYLLRVFVNTEKQPPLIITVYKTSKFSKYEN
ncbi:MAG: DUF4258 domain-containing protein [Prevotellaceae bacterium]|jgi:hypothetical protein|nr:DUF4258 domain-containing protein [Prevotellaceae bacterium]